MSPDSTRPERLRPVVDGVRTLPLYINRFRLQEKMPPFGNAKAVIEYPDPSYCVRSYEPPSDWLPRFRNDPVAARSVVEDLGRHISDFTYYVQFRGDPDRQRIAAINDHMKLVSLYCDTSLQIDTAVLWEAFDGIYRFAQVHYEYREDPLRDAHDEEHCSKLRDSWSRVAPQLRQTGRLIDRVCQVLEAKCKEQSLSTTASGIATEPMSIEDDGKLASFPVRGRFHVVLKGEVAIFLNGTKLRYDEQSQPEVYARTHEVKLHEGDVVVLQITSRYVHRCMRIGFVSSDGRIVLPVRVEHLRRVDELQVQDITTVTLKASHMGATRVRPDKGREETWTNLGLPLRESEWLWGPDKDTLHRLGFIVDSSKVKVASPKEDSSTGMPASQNRFHIALSFPGEHRSFVAEIAELLASNLSRSRVFYDEWYEAELLGTGGDVKLQSMYKQADLVIPFFSKYYSKPWCSLEWETIRGILLNRRKDDAVIPVHLDDTEVEGWSSVNFGIRLRGRKPQEIADLILEAFELRRSAAADRVVQQEN